MDDAEDRRPLSSGDRRPGPAASALPSVGARVVAFLTIVVAGACGALIGYAFIDLQCEGDCTVPAGLFAILGAAIAAGGVAVVVVLALRAMGEWKTIRDDPDRRP